MRHHRFIDFFLIFGYSSDLGLVLSFDKLANDPGCDLDIDMRGSDAADQRYTLHRPGDQNQAFKAPAYTSLADSPFMGGAVGIWLANLVDLATVRVEPWLP